MPRAEPRARRRARRRCSAAPNRGGDGPRRSDGAGLGLSIVRAIAEAHGGHVTLASLPGQGAVFTLHLPVASAPPAPPPDVVVDDLDHVTTSSPAPEAHTR